MATPWNVTLSTSADTVFDASTYSDMRLGTTLYFTASAAFWFSDAPFTGTFPPVVAAGTAGRASKFAAGSYTWALTDTEKLYFRADSGTPTMEGVVTST